MDRSTQKTLDKLRALLDAGEYYEGEQALKSAYYRLKGRKRTPEAVSLLVAGVREMVAARQWACASELHDLLLTAWKDEGTPLARVRGETAALVRGFLRGSGAPGAADLLAEGDEASADRALDEVIEAMGGSEGGGAGAPEGEESGRKAPAPPGPGDTTDAERRRVFGLAERAVTRALVAKGSADGSAEESDLLEEIWSSGAGGSSDEPGEGGDAGATAHPATLMRDLAFLALALLPAPHARPTAVQLFAAAGEPELAVRAALEPGAGVGFGRVASSADGGGGEGLREAALAVADLTVTRATLLAATASVTGGFQPSDAVVSDVATRGRAWVEARERALEVPPTASPSGGDPSTAPAPSGPSSSPLMHFAEIFAAALAGRSWRLCQALESHYAGALAARDPALVSLAAAARKARCPPPARPGGGLEGLLSALLPPRAPAARG